MRRSFLATLTAALFLAACDASTTGPRVTTTSVDESGPDLVVTPSVPLPVPSPTRDTAVASPSPSASTTTPDAALGVRTELRVRIERLVDDPATVGFRDEVLAVLTDPRGWVRAGFDVVADPQGEYLVVLAEGDEVDRRCLPLDTGGRFSCQNGPVVALNADRWRTATPQWTGSLADYRVMLVNHEFGHLLHLHHPEPQCPGPGLPAPVMLQQSTELGECTANPWPLPWEVDLAAARLEPLAPPPEHDVSDHRPSPPPQERSLP